MRRAQSPSRKYRRGYEKVLKKYNKEEYVSYKSEVFERAKELEQAQRERVIKSEEEWLEKKQIDMINSFKKFGYSDEDIDKKIENWLDNLKLYCDKW